MADNDHLFKYIRLNEPLDGPSLPSVCRDSIQKRLRPAKRPVRIKEVRRL
jgi:hypothetical protein